jgi:hypothetical protein
MNVNDIVTYTATLLDFDYPPQQKDRYFLVLFRELLRKNRMVAEQEGIGRDTQLSRKTAYCVTDFLGKEINGLTDDVSLLYYELTHELQEEYWRERS